LFESRQLLMAIIDNSAAVIYVKNLQGRYLLVNRRFCELFRVSKEEVLEKTDHDIFPKAAADAFNAMDKRVAAADTTLQEQETAPHDDGLHTYISVKSTLRDASGQLYGVFGISTDITELKAVEASLRKSIREISDYKFALDESSIVAITDQKGIIHHVNDNFCRISGYRADELLGQDHRIINSGYHPKEFIRGLWTTIAHGHIWKGELKNKAKDGSFYWVDTTIIPFLDEKGKPYQYVAIRADITSRKQAEEALYKLNQELENRVNLRTVQLEAATKEMEAFTYSVSHDLRAPLRGIVGFASILEEDYSDKLDNEAKRITGIIKNNTLKMGQLIDDLLAFSRMGRQDMPKTGIDMQVLVQGIIHEFASGNTYEPAIEWEIQALPPVQADINTIRQVWVNLLSNAIKYSGKKERPHIAIGSFMKEEQTVFFVRDNGIGFDYRYRDKLFKVFQRLHSPSQFEGTGVGLALVAKIISKHGGQVWAEGEVGKGACFYFSLPTD
jgi:PAS domain S-box-containing protein